MVMLADRGLWLNLIQPRINMPSSPCISVASTPLLVLSASSLDFSWRVLGEAMVPIKTTRLVLRSTPLVQDMRPIGQTASRIGAIGKNTQQKFHRHIRGCQFETGTGTGTRPSEGSPIREVVRITGFPNSTRPLGSFVGHHTHGRLP